MPVLPEVLTKIQQIMHSEGTSIEMVANLIKKDPALSAQVLKITNSAYYSLPMEISEVKTAVAYLGITEIHRIALAYSVVNTIDVEEEEDFTEIWSHSLYSALCARHLAHKYKPLLNPGEVWTSALLHDIGKLVYLKFFPDHYRELASYKMANGCLFSEAEKILGFPASSYFGKLLCARWRLPKNVTIACETHTFADLVAQMNGAEEKDDFSFVIILGNLGAVLTNDQLQEEKIEEISDAMMSFIDINRSDLLLLLGELSDLKIETDRLL